MKSKAYALLLFLIGYGWLNAQSLTIQHVEFKSNKLTISYSLIDTVAGRAYIIRAYSSADGFTTPLSHVTGDVGLNIKTGINKRIEWDFQHELSSTFEGKFSVELKARVFIPFINTESINTYKVFKRTRNYNLTWSGGSSQNVLNFDLYRGDRKVASYPNIGNSGHHTFRFQNHIKPGKNYRFKISDSKNEDEVVYTENFQIKRKVPLVIKAVPIVLAGSLLYIILSNKSTGESDIKLPQEHP